MDNFRDLLEQWARGVDRQELARKNKNRCVYILECRGLYKIGKTGDLQKRTKSMQTANPFPMQLMHVIFTERHDQVEHALHLIFAENRERDEWFNLGLRDLAAIKSWSMQQILDIARSRMPKESNEPVIPPDQMTFNW